jgi:tRNA G37 N-methylase Trm5
MNKLYKEKQHIFCNYVEEPLFLLLATTIIRKYGLVHFHEMNHR